MARQETETQFSGVLLGALVGGALAGAAALLLAPKSGQELREDIQDVIMDQIGETNESNNNFVWGSVAGTVLGAITTLVLAPKGGRALGRDLTKAYEGFSTNANRYLTKGRRVLRSERKRARNIISQMAKRQPAGARRR